MSELTDERLVEITRAAKGMYQTCFRCPILPEVPLLVAEVRRLRDALLAILAADASPYIPAETVIDRIEQIAEAALEEVSGE